MLQPRTFEFAAAAATMAGVAAATLTYAALSPASQLFGRTLVAGNDPHQLALTYDDGPNDAASGTAALLDLLAAHDTRATFFMIGNFVHQQPDLARRVHAAGHLIGNHTETHRWLHTKSRQVIHEELRACNQALEDTLGASVRYFRPPHGARRPFVLQAARELGLTTVQWNVTARDWQSIGVAAILANVERGLKRSQSRGMGANILLHDGNDRAMGTDRGDTLAVTEVLLNGLAAAKMQAVTVDTWDAA
jgi:peptidoglycan/xylan/chitin deacetylase (PgdA/CDA1 family)